MTVQTKQLPCSSPATVDDFLVPRRGAATVFAHTWSKIFERPNAIVPPPVTNRVGMLMLTMLLAAFAACNRKLPSTALPRPPKDACARPAFREGESQSLDARLDRKLSKRMTRGEAFAAIGAQGTAGGPSSVLCCATSVISDEYADKAIDLYFEYDDAQVPRLTTWKLRKKGVAEFYFPLVSGHHRHR